MKKSTWIFLFRLDIILYPKPPSKLKIKAFYRQLITYTTFIVQLESKNKNTRTLTITKLIIIYYN